MTYSDDGYGYGYGRFYYVGGGAYLNDPGFYDPGFYSYVPYGYSDGYYSALNPNYNFIGGDAGYYGYGSYDGYGL